MYQLFSFTMLLALLTNNIGILWVAMEAATLTTVLLVSLYRTPASLEAAWKYFILCGVGIAQALFGTILLYFAAENACSAAGGTALLWTHLYGVKDQLEPTVLGARLRLPARRLRHQGRAWCRCTTGCPTRTPKARRRSRRCCPGCCSTSRCTRWCAARCWSTARSARRFAGNLMMGFGLLSVVVAAFFLSRQKDIKRLFAYSSIEHMGLDHLRVRHGRAGRDLRRPAAHDGAFAHQVGDLLRRRPRRAEDRHAGDRRHPRPDHTQSRPSAGV